MQRQLQEHRFVLKKIETVAGDLGGGLEIHEIELLADLDVIPRREVERRQGSRAVGHLDRLHAQRGSRMGEIGDGAEQTVLLGSHPVHFGLGRGDLLPQPASLFLAGVALGRILGLANRLGDFIGAAVQLVHLLLASLAAAFQFHDAADVGPAPRFLQFCWTSSAFSTTNLRSSMGFYRGRLEVGDLKIILAPFASYHRRD